MRDLIEEGRALLDEITPGKRERMKKSSFVFPERKGWPIHDQEHAIRALAYIQAKRGDSSDYPAVKAAVRKRWGKDPEVAAKLKEVGG